MFARPEYVFKDGELVVRKGRVVKETQGCTHSVRPEYDRGIERRLRAYLDRYHTIGLDSLRVRDDEIVDGGRGRLELHPCQPVSRG